MPSDEEEDYLTMRFEEPAPETRVVETYSQRRARKLREHETNSHIKPAKELELERREEGLAKNMFAAPDKKETKAMKMMKMMGYSEGTALGASESNGHIEPLSVEMPEGRKGIGHDMDKKRKLKELYEDSVKRPKEDSDSYRNTVRSERVEARLQENLKQAQKVCQNLDTKAAESTGNEVAPNVFWRGLDRDREMEHKEKRFRNRIMYERSANPLGESDDEEYDSVVQDLEGEDTELDEFEALPLENQLEMILHYMRETYFYCFWCGCAYDDAEDLAENCPGLNEDDH